MPTPEQFLSKRQRYQPVAVPQHVSEEDMARDWTLSDHDRAEVSKYRKSSRLFVAIQLCAVRLYGRFCAQVHDLSPHIGHYLGRQLDLPPSLALEVPVGVSARRSMIYLLILAITWAASLIYHRPWRSKSRTVKPHIRSIASIF